MIRFPEAPARFMRMSAISFKALFGWLKPEIYVLAKIVSPVCQLIFFTLLAGWAGKTKDLAPFAIGNAMTLCALNSVFSVGGLVDEERSFGTLSLLVLSPANKISVFVARALFHLLDAFITVGIGIAAGIILFGLRLGNADITVFVLSLVSGIISATGLGLCIGSFALVTRDMGFVTNLFLMTVTTLTGANYPVEALPPFLKLLSGALPLTRAIQAARMAAVSPDAAFALPLVAGELAMGIAFTAAGFVTLSLCERIAKTKATLDIF